MEKRRIGRSELRVAPLCLGGNVFGWTVDETASFRLLDAFVDAGFDFVDTADVYARWAGKPGISETIIGRWLKRSGKRGRIVLATKVGLEMGEAKKGLSPRYIRQAVEDSLQRLQTETIDLYQSHRDDEETPQAETLGVYAELMKEGKVRAIGASNFSAARLRDALALSAKEGLPRYECLQPEYNLYERQGYEAALDPLCRKEEVGVITYYSLASGFLTGKYRSAADAGKSARGQGIAGKYLNERGFRILAALDSAAARLKATQAQVAVAWLMARPGVTAPIASATSPAQLDELIGATRIRLDADTIAELDRASA